MVDVVEAGPPLRRARLRLSAAFWRRPWLKLTLLLALPALAFLVVYLGSLGALFVSAFWHVDSFTGNVVHAWSWTNFSTLWHDHTYWRIAFRTLWMAAAVTLTDAVLAFPLAFFLAPVRPPRLPPLVFLPVHVPLCVTYH